MSCGALSHTPEYSRKYGARYRREHSDIVRVQRSESRARHPEKARSRCTKWRSENQEEIRIYRAAYNNSHREQNSVYSAKWRKENPTYSSEWSAKNPESRRAITNNYRSRRRANGGTFHHAAWEYLKTLFGHCCAYCGRRMKNLTQDHVIPISKGGWHFSGNIVPACQSCNARKGVLV